jgi:hypothetical protein
VDEGSSNFVVLVFLWMKLVKQSKEKIYTISGGPGKRKCLINGEVERPGIPIKVLHSGRRYLCCCV